jgi:hypothetical protein
MSEPCAIAATLIEEGIAARGHFQVWWTLRNKALPQFYETMNNRQYVAFFLVSTAAHFKTFLLALSKIFDRDNRVAGLSEFRRALTNDGRQNLADHIEQQLSQFHDRIKAVLNIRSQSLVHNERALPRDQAYKLNGITPDQILELIDVHVRQHQSCGYRTWHQQYDFGE